jgi:hypothetical protein
MQYLSRASIGAMACWLLSSGASYAITVSKQPDASSSCLQGEQILFSCSHGVHVYSLCASSKVSATEGYFEYRVNKGMKPELIFPATPQPPKGLFEFAHDSGHSYWLAFTNGGYQYELSNTIGGNGHVDGEEITVSKNEKTVSQISCNNPVEDAGFDWTEVEELLEKAGVKRP